MPTDVHVPLLGDVPKGGLFAGVLAAVGVGGYYVYKHYKNQQTAAANAAQSTNASAYGYGATAYGYGSPYSYGYGVSSQYGYGYGAYGYGYGEYGYGGGGTTPPVTATTNAQWAQNVTTALENQGYSGQQILTALGAYLSGRSIQKGSAEDNLIQAAIALEGDPPVSGTGGYPPAVNYTGGGGGQGGGSPKDVQDVHVVGTGRDYIRVGWSPSSGVKSYSVRAYQGNRQVKNATTGATTYDITGLSKNTDYHIFVRAANGPAGPGIDARTLS